MNFRKARTMAYEAVKAHVPEAVLDVVKRSRFRNEIKLVNGESIRSCAERSVCFFTTIKCASTYVGRAMHYLNKKCLGLVYADLEYYVHACSNQNLHRLLEEQKAEVFRPHGVFYVPLRRYFPVPLMDRYRIVLMLRDPRDVVVSSYYSHAYSHPLPSNKSRREVFLRRRNEIRKQTVDEYAVGPVADAFRNTYTEYCDYLIKERNVRFLRYEDFMEDFDSWVTQLGDCLEIEISRTHRRDLYKLKGGKSKTTEDKFQHVRKATPGDYKEKLTEESQEILNAKFKDVLITLNYE